ncbi:hypothetical protein ACFFLS_10590 [Flavobacterium procerum]|uniref:Uncharacterized protein n=1 Tax=Flavobacterium procerum TaxID=1455569 RepID=A0ABV6BPW1_9FLAO
MEHKFNDWAMYLNVCASYSETFRQEMSMQLLEEFYRLLEFESKPTKNKFRLSVGLHPLKTEYENGYAFSVVHIVAPDSLSRPVTAYWKPKNGESVENAFSLDIWNKENIEFGWCTDFDKNVFLVYFEPKNLIPKKQLESNFDYEYDYTLFPDLSCTICFSRKVYLNELIQIATILTETIKDSYISDLRNEDGEMESNKNNETIVIFDFQDNDFEKSKKQLENAIKKIGQNSVGKLIEKIIVE